jgi:hypothetical protein
MIFPRFWLPWRNPNLIDEVCIWFGRLVLAARRLMCGRYKTRPDPQVFFALFSRESVKPCFSTGSNVQEFVAGMARNGKIEP